MQIILQPEEVTNFQKSCEAWIEKYNEFFHQNLTIISDFAGRRATAPEKEKIADFQKANPFPKLLPPV